MDLMQLVQTVGVTSAVFFIGSLVLFRHLDRRSKIQAEQDHSHLDDTETLRELTKEDRELLRIFQNRNDDLTKTNIEMIRKQSETEKELAILRKELAERMSDCSGEQARQKDEMERLKMAIDELRKSLQDCIVESSKKDTIISQLRAG